jgi:hypothetical protein
MSTESQSKQEMLGQFLREAAVLVFVFGFLDLPSRGRGQFDLAAELLYGVAVLVVSATSLWLGMRLEIERKVR